MANFDTGTKELLCDISDGVATLTLNRPEKRNAFGSEMTAALHTCLTDFATNPYVRVLILTGAGTAFCAGGDVSAMGDQLGGGAAKPHLEDMIRNLQSAQERLSLALYEFPKPTIAALPGAAAGAGMSLALACDLRVAATSGALVPAFGAIGLSGDFGGSWYLSHLIGPGRAKEIYFTGRKIDATEGEKLGVFNRVVPDKQLMLAAKMAAAHIAQGAPIALQYMKKNHNIAMTTDLRSAMAIEGEHMMRAMQTTDHKNAVKAFFEKRPPKFEGH